MSLEGLNRWLTLAANIGVLAGIIFLAMELRQNNDNLEAQARRDQFEFRSAAGAMLVTNTDMADVAFKARSGDRLTASEEFRFEMWAYQVFRAWDWQFDEYLAGTLEVEEFAHGWVGQSIQQLSNP